jgi:hypothetical protein
VAIPVTLRDDWRNVAHPRRLSPNHPHRDEILVRHADAVAMNLPVYPDPASALGVFTADFLARRGYCCDSGCRHCPFVDGATERLSDCIQDARHAPVASR